MREVRVRCYCVLANTQEIALCFFRLHDVRAQVGRNHLKGARVWVEGDRRHHAHLRRASMREGVVTKDCDGTRNRASDGPAIATGPEAKRCGCVVKIGLIFDSKCWKQGKSASRPGRGPRQVEVSGSGPRRSHSLAKLLSSTGGSSVTEFPRFTQWYSIEVRKLVPVQASLARSSVPYTYTGSVAREGAGSRASALSPRSSTVNV